ncbi:MAG TPA: hypothetical protein VHK69_06955, partial [Chitinophagaceae bacterium]|nr:hypothetical protein [Chitinophagaceae bacterium]
MEVKRVHLKWYKGVYVRGLVAVLLTIFFSWLLVQNGWFAGHSSVSVTLTNFLLYGMVLVAFVFSWYQRRELKKLQSITEFTARVNHHRKYYRNRLAWFVLSVITSCFLYYLTGRGFFLYFSLFELV